MKADIRLIQEFINWFEADRASFTREFALRSIVDNFNEMTKTGFQDDIENNISFFSDGVDSVGSEVYLKCFLIWMPRKYWSIAEDSDDLLKIAKEHGLFL